MKQFSYTYVFIILISCLLVTACTDNNDDTPNDTTQNQIEDNVVTSTWRITKYIDSDTDETSDYTGYNFTFGTNQVLTASNGVNNYIGTWSISDSNSNDDSHDDLDFNIFFASPEDFEELSDDWDFISQSSTKIELIDISGGSGETDLLTFERN